MTRRITVLGLLIMCFGLLVTSPVRAGDDEEAPSERSASDRNIVLLTGEVALGGGIEADNVVVGKGNVKISGTVTDTVLVGSGRAQITGIVEGDVIVLRGTARVEAGGVVEGDVIAPNIVVDAEASVGGEARELSPSNAIAVVTTVVQDVVKTVSFLFFVAASVSYLLLGLATIGLAPQALAATARTGGTSAAKSAGWGTILTLALPLLVVVFLVLRVTIPFALGLFLGLFLLNAVGYMVTLTTVGQVGLRLANVRQADSLAIPFAAGWVVFTILALIPWVGLVVVTLGSMYGVGAVGVTVWRARRPGGSLGAPDPTSEPASV